MDGRGGFQKVVIRISEITNDTDALIDTRKSSVCPIDLMAPHNAGHGRIMDAMEGESLVHAILKFQSGKTASFQATVLSPCIILTKTI